MGLHKTVNLRLTKYIQLLRDCLFLEPDFLLQFFWLFILTSTETNWFFSNMLLLLFGFFVVDWLKKRLFINKKTLSVYEPMVKKTLISYLLIG